MISNNHPNATAQELKDKEFRLVSVIRFQTGRYVIHESGMDAIKIPVQKSYKNSLRQASGNVEYMEHETYYVFARKPA